jgi:hypothetical protein
MELHAAGVVFEAAIDHASGDPWADGAALDDDALRDKFRTFCRPLLSEQQIATAVDLVAQLDSEPGVERLVAALVA